MGGKGRAPRSPIGTLEGKGDKGRKLPARKPTEMS